MHATDAQVWSGHMGLCFLAQNLEAEALGPTWQGHTFQGSPVSSTLHSV